VDSCCVRAVCLLLMCNDVIMAQDLRNKHLTKCIMDVLIWDFFLGGGVNLFTLFTAAPSLIFNGNESQAVRDRPTSLQWVELFLDCSADETLQKYLFKEFQLTTKLHAIWAVENYKWSRSFIQWMPLKTSLTVSLS